VSRRIGCPRFNTGSGAVAVLSQPPTPFSRLEQNRTDPRQDAQGRSRSRRWGRREAPVAVRIGLGQQTPSLAGAGATLVTTE